MIGEFRQAFSREIFRAAFEKWRGDHAARLGAALAYYTVFSLAPLLIIVIGVAGAALGREAAQGQIIEQIEGLVGRESAAFIQEMIANAAKDRGSGAIATLTGMAVLLFGAAGMFGQLQGALDTIWDAPRRRGGWVDTLREHGMTFLMVLGVGFLLLVSLVISAVLSAASDVVAHYIAIPAFALQLLNIGLSLVFITVLFAMIFKILPNVKIEWADVRVGAFIAAALFTIGKYSIGWYLGHSAVASAYGAAGSLVVILIWTYYSAQILLFGAEFTQVHASARARARRSHLPPQPDLGSDPNRGFCGNTARHFLAAVEHE